MLIIDLLNRHQNLLGMVRIRKPSIPFEIKLRFLNSSKEFSERFLTPINKNNPKSIVLFVISFISGPNILIFPSSIKSNSSIG